MKTHNWQTSLANWRNKPRITKTGNEKRYRTIDSVDIKGQREHYEQFYAKRLENIDKIGKPESQRNRVFEYSCNCYFVILKIAPPNTHKNPSPRYTQEVSNSNTI